MAALMPGEFTMFFFDDNTTWNQGFPAALQAQPATAAQQIARCVKWVCITNGLYNAIEHIAIKYPFAAGVGRKVPGAVNGGPNELALDVSARGLLRELKGLPALIYDSVKPLLLTYITTWDAVTVGVNGGQDEYRQNTIDEDRAIYGDMAPEGRMDLVMSLIQNLYATHLRLIQGRYPLINLFDVFLDAAVRGKVGASIASMAHAV